MQPSGRDHHSTSRLQLFEQSFGNRPRSVTVRRAIHHSMHQELPCRQCVIHFLATSHYGTLESRSCASIFQECSRATQLLPQHGCNRRAWPAFSSLGYMKTRRRHGSSQTAAMHVTTPLVPACVSAPGHLLVALPSVPLLELKQPTLCMLHGTR